jgi:hypothetical protein
MNREDAITTPLSAATPDMQLVGSLVPMWQQERWRLGGASIPPPPPSPRRCLQPLCPAVEALREDFRVSSGAGEGGESWVVCLQGLTVQAIISARRVLPCVSR